MYQSEVGRLLGSDVFRQVVVMIQACVDKRKEIQGCQHKLCPEDRILDIL